MTRAHAGHIDVRVHLCDRRAVLRLLAPAAVLALACRPPVPDLPPSPPRDAHTLLAERCDRGEAAVCLDIASSYRDAGDRARSVAYVTRACELASPRACNELADALTTGDTIPSNPARALDLRVQACLGGFAAACRLASQRLPEPEATAFRQRACAAGDSDLCPPPPERPPPSVDPRDQAAVVLALAARRDALRACYTDALATDPRLRGRIALQIAVGPEGLARAAAILERLDPTVDECVLAIVASTPFAPTTTGEIVLVPWHTVFEPE